MRKERFKKFDEDYDKIKERINTNTPFPSLELAIYILKYSDKIEDPYFHKFVKRLSKKYKIQKRTIWRRIYIMEKK